MIKRTIWVLLSVIGLTTWTLRADWAGDKYSMFIHYGLYSIPAGVWDGKPVRVGYSEQILTFGIGFSDRYEALARSFTAEGFCADSIVKLAKQAGMRSIVMTAKHHDGFCLFRTHTTKYNSYDGTPARRDLLGELSEACHREGLGFGIYFSLIDWHYPGAVPFTSHNADPITPDHHNYNISQVTELLTKYGRVDELWFDMGSLTKTQSQELYSLVHKLQPDCMVSGRLGNDFADFCVMPDNQFPDYDMALPWQTAASFFPETWGYRSWQDRGEVISKVYEKIDDLVSVVSRGGKYLLNIGPMGSGAVVPFESDVLTAIGREIAPMSEAIYNTLPSPYPMSEGMPLATLSRDKSTIYFFCREGMDKIDLNRLVTKVADVRLLNAQGQVSIQPAKTPRIDIKVEGRRPYFTVVRVRLDAALVLDTPPSALKTLAPQSAHPLYAQSAIDYYTGFRSILGYQWEINGRTSKGTLTFTDEEIGKGILISLDGNTESLQKLTPTSSRKVTFDPKSIRWKSLHTVSKRGLFGSVPEEYATVPLSPKVGWQSKGLTMDYHDIVHDRTAVYLRYEVEANQTTELPLELSYRDGYLLYLDGIYIAGHIARPEDESSKCTQRLLLPLKKGKHTLLIKVYSRWGGALDLSIRTLNQYTLHEMPIELKGARSIRITKERVLPFAAPARLYNLRVNL